MSLCGWATDADLLGRRCHVEQLAGLPRHVPQEICKGLTLTNLAELDGIPLDRSPNKVVEPPTPRCSGPTQRQGHSPGAHAIDILRPRRG